MPIPIQVTYLHHSGFAIRTHDTLMVFDDAQGIADEGESLATGRITPAQIDAQPNTVFFVSHAHADHFNESIYSVASHPSVSYVIGYDLPEECAGIRMRPGDTAQLPGMQVTAYDSTDAGVSFLVEIAGWRIFHAGDLNLWHWRAESTLREIDQAETDFLQAVTPLVGQEIDFAFFPLDPRMGEMYDAGALYFLMQIKPRVMIPMHWWERSDAAIDFARRNRTKHVELIALTSPGETIRAQKQPDGHILIDL